jgi:hypothetical protein
MADLRGGDPDAAREVFDRFARRLAALAAWSDNRVRCFAPAVLC